MAENWTCPHCGRPQTATKADLSVEDIFFNMTETAFGHLGIQATAACCANPECNKPLIHVEVKRTHGDGLGRWYFVKEDSLVSRRLIPESSVKPQPDYIPKPIVEDYTEACLIRDLSPKASATLSRRCLQGMIRDFCDISEPTLFKEISKLRNAVDEGNAQRGVSIESVEAINQVRGVGNIGAHMGKNIDHIVPIDSGEAQILIDLIEMLFEDWYVARQRRQDRFASISALAEDKKDAISKHKAAKE